VDLDPRVRYGLPYLVAGDALAKLGRWDEALDAFERYVDGNSSDVAAYTRLARAHDRTKNRAAAREALHEALRTWRLLPASMKRRQFSAYLGAQVARVTLLREPGATLVLFACSALLGLVGYLVYTPVLWLFTASAPWHGSAGFAPGQSGLHEAFSRCGTQSTGDFAGRYDVLPENFELDPAIAARLTPEQSEATAKATAYIRNQYAGFEIRGDRIVSGRTLTQEFCLTRVLERTPTTLVAECVWHEDVGDPGDASLVTVTLHREGPRTTMRVSEPGGLADGDQFEIVLRKR
jgi:tetratricopeptide (TPR) repeat protein